MEVVKSTKEYSIFKKRNSRYAVVNASGKNLNADEKVKILVAEGLVTLPKAKAKPVEEAAPEAEEASEE